MSLNYLATRFTCSWPWSIARHAVRRPRRLRLRRSVRQARARRCADDVARRHLARAVGQQLRDDLNSGGSSFCGDCPLKLPLAPDQTAPQRDLDVAPLPNRLYIECTAACNISCFQACCAPETGITRTRQAGMLDFDLFTRVVDEAGPVARPHRLLQLRRGVPAQARRRDVRVHQDEVPAHLSLHEHQRPGASPRRRRAGSCTRASTR